MPLYCFLGIGGGGCVKESGEKGRGEEERGWRNSGATLVTANAAQNNQLRQCINCLFLQYIG